jgi:hypothetical protein
MPDEDAVEIRETLIAYQGRRIRRLMEALAFARSVIKSGEPWTDECERIIGGALFDGGE